MAEITIKKWQCDRCRQVFDEKPKRSEHQTIYTLTATEDAYVSGGALINWQEMCHPCNAKVGDEIRDLVEAAKADRDD